MIEHKPMPVAGYTAQSDRKVGLVNANKRIEENILRAMDEMQSDQDIDQRWLALARTQIEQGFMALNRAIFRSTT
jgi:1,4-dihydroxy-2-naphthoyl-CoA synthase